MFYSVFNYYPVFKFKKVFEYILTLTQTKVCNIQKLNIAVLILLQIKTFMILYILRKLKSYYYSKNR